jgi:hypothetical protein
MRTDECSEVTHNMSFEGLGQAPGVRVRTLGGTVQAHFTAMVPRCAGRNASPAPGRGGGQLEGPGAGTCQCHCHWYAHWQHPGGLGALGPPVAAHARAKAHSSIGKGLRQEPASGACACLGPLRGPARAKSSSAGTQAKAHQQCRAPRLALQFCLPLLRGLRKLPKHFLCRALRMFK